MKSRNLLFISEQSYQPINRSVHAELKQLGIHPTVWVPYPEEWAPPENDIFPVQPIPIGKYHPRKSLIKLTADHKRQLAASQSVIVEADMGSMILNQIILFKVLTRSQFDISISTFENIQKNYLLLAVKQGLLGLNPSRMLGFLAIYALEFFASFFVRNVFVFSQGSLDVNGKKFGAKSVRLVPLGICARRFSSERSVRRIRNIGYLGRIIEEKRPDFVIDVFRELKQSNKDLKLIFQCPSRYGGGFAESVNEMLSSLEHQDSVTIVDPTHEEMPEILKKVDLLLVPSIQNSVFKEQYGRIIVEGKLCKCIVLAGDSGALAEVLGFPEMIVKSHEIEPWLKACRRLIDMDGDGLSAMSDAVQSDARLRQTAKIQAQKLSEIL